MCLVNGNLLYIRIVCRETIHYFVDLEAVEIFYPSSHHSNLLIHIHSSLLFIWFFFLFMKLFSVFQLNYVLDDSVHWKPRVIIKPGVTGGTISVWISNYIHHKVWDEITHPFLNFNSASIDIRDWLSNFISHFTRLLIGWPDNGLKL